MKKVILAALVAVALSGCADKKCVDRSVVDSILSLSYDHAVIKLQDGRTTIIGRETLNVGDTYCVQWRSE